MNALTTCWRWAIGLQARLAIGVCGVMVAAAWGAETNLVNTPQLEPIELSLT